MFISLFEQFADCLIKYSLELSNRFLIDTINNALGCIKNLFFQKNQISFLTSTYESEMFPRVGKATATMQ